MRAIYVAAPYGSGEAVEANVRRAIDAGEEVSRAGGYPFIPHLAKLWSEVYPQHAYEFWMDWDAEWLMRCDAVLRLPGHSPGADREVALADSRGMPVFHDLPTLARWIGGTRLDSTHDVAVAVDLSFSGEWVRPNTAPNRSE